MMGFPQQSPVLSGEFESWLEASNHHEIVIIKMEWIA